MISSKTLKEIVSEARPIIERQLDDAEMIAGLRDVVANAGGDWSALKALIKAQIQDERDETGNGKRVKKILDKAGFSTDYASLLGWSNMNEKNFSADEEFDRETGEVLDDVNPRLAKQIVDGMQTEAGRAALIAAVDIMIEREEAEEQVPSSEQSEGNGSRDHQHVHSRQTDGANDRGWQDGQAAAPDHVGDAAANAHGIPEPHSEKTTAARGDAGRHSLDSVSPQAASATTGSVDANTGGDHVTASEYAATHQAGGLVQNPPAKPLRPNCLRPDNCAGFGSNHCYSCGKAAKAVEVAA